MPARLPSCDRVTPPGSAPLSRHQANVPVPPAAPSAAVNMPPTLPEGSVVVVIAIGMGATVIVTGFAAVRSIRQESCTCTTRGSRAPGGRHARDRAGEWIERQTCRQRARHDRPGRRPEDAGDGWRQLEGDADLRHGHRPGTSTSSGGGAMVSDSVAVAVLVGHAGSYADDCQRAGFARSWACRARLRPSSRTQRRRAARC